MKNNKGITLIVLILYIILTVLIIGVLAKLTISLKNNVDNVNDQTMYNVEFDKFNAQLLKDIETEGNFIDARQTTSTKIVFTNGNIYEYDSSSKAIYFNNNIKLSQNIQECNFELLNRDEKLILKTTLKVVEQKRITEYVVKTIDTSSSLNLSLDYKKVAVELGENVRDIKEGVPIPTGFYYVGGTKLTGIVISDEQSDENITNTTISETLNGNQFVWVPVLQNQTIKIDAKTTAPITGITIKDPLARTDLITKDKDGQDFTLGETTLLTEVTPTINGLYTVTIETEDAEEILTETIRISSLYAQDFWIDYEYPEEPYKATEISDALTFSDTTISTHLESINTYGGFYIGRYEAGSQTARTSDSAPLTTVYSKKNLYPYNYISKENAIDIVEVMYSSEGNPSITSVTITLPNGAAWDRTLNWLIETDAVEEAEVVTDSTSWGNYSNSEFNFLGKYSIDYGANYTEATVSTEKQKYEESNNFYLLGTGITEYTNRRNIYDLAGNCFEFTTEAHSSNGDEVIRGGFYGRGGWESPAGYRSDNNASLNDDRFSFRPVLYINE